MEEVGDEMTEVSGGSRGSDGRQTRKDKKYEQIRVRYEKKGRKTKGNS